MRNTWKGLVVGAMTGAAVGIVMDSAIRGGQKAAELGASAKQVIQDRAPEARDWAEAKGQHASDWARDELPDKARHAADKLRDATDR